MSLFVPRVLSIAGSDPSGGAGIQADIKSISAAGGYGMTVVTALTAQNTTGVESVHTPPLEFLEAQLDSVLTDIKVDALKIGMLADSNTIGAVARRLERIDAPVVLDPVMVSTSGDRLLPRDAEDALRSLVSHSAVDLVTPNLLELAVLADVPPPASLEDAIEVALPFAQSNNVTVIVKGGHLKAPHADNAAVTPRAEVTRVDCRRVESSNTHGTGCSLSSALATRLGAGDSVPDALRWATEWLREAIVTGHKLEIGHGQGPVDHFHRLRRLASAGRSVPWKPSKTAPDPRLPSSGPHTAALWDSAGDVLERIYQLDFIQSLRNGTLHRSAFEFYLAQDAAYLLGYAEALRMLARSSGQTYWKKQAEECLQAERSLHESWLRNANVPAEEISPITLNYVNHLLASTRDPVVGTASILPCAWFYAEVGLSLAEVNAPEHPYAEWLNTYSTNDFVDSVRRAIDYTEEALSTCDDSTRAEATRAFYLSCEHELEFFDQAMRLH